MIYIESAILITIPGRVLPEIDRLIQKFIWKLKELRIVKTILKKNTVERLILPDFKTCYKSIVIKIVWYLLKDEHIDQTYR